MSDGQRVTRRARPSKDTCGAGFDQHTGAYTQKYGVGCHTLHETPSDFRLIGVHGTGLKEFTAS